MIEAFIDGVTGAPVYINPEFVMSLRPDADEPERKTVVKLRDGESMRVLGDHREVASKLQGATAARAA